MKKISIIGILLLFQFHVQGQDLNQKIAEKLCECISEAEDAGQLEERLNNCFPLSMAAVLPDASAEEKALLGSVEGVQQVIGEVQEVLPYHCEEVREAVLAYRRDLHYRMSDSERANSLFDAGNRLMAEGDFSRAIRKFKKAVKIDPSFVYAIDHIAIAYRQMEDLPSAISYYEQSLAIYPEGDLALLNMAVAYSLLPDYEKSLAFYEELSWLYPHNPEGYFGIARISFVLEEYEQALENLFIAHKIYVAEESDYLEDSIHLVGLMYHKMKELETLDLFFAKAEEHGVKIDFD